MVMRRGEDPHPGTTWVFSPRCTYCGSVSPERFLQVLRDGEDASGSDWKYGWPHKFYAGRTHEKFYSRHLLLQDAPAFEALSEMIDAVLGVRFSYDETERLKYSAPVHGYQTFRGKPDGMADPDDL